MRRQCMQCHREALPSKQHCESCHRRPGYDGRPKPKRRTRGERKRKPYRHRRQWALLRQAHLAKYPHCHRCARISKRVAADQVDHIIPLAWHPAGELDPENLQSLCRSCHGTKTRREQGGQAFDYRKGRVYHKETWQRAISPG